MYFALNMKHGSLRNAINLNKRNAKFEVILFLKIHVSFSEKKKIIRNVNQNHNATTIAYLSSSYIIYKMILKSVRVSVPMCVSVCKSPQRLLNAGTQKVGKGTKKRQKIHRGARDHFRRIRFIISRVIN